MPTLVEIPGHPREQYIASVLERFANTGVQDQIVRLCADGSAKLPTFVVPTIARQIELDGPIERAATVMAAWARYLAVVEPDDQPFDSRADDARRHAERAVANPVAFLDFDAVFPPELRESLRFRSEFASAYRRIAEEGPIAAMQSEPDRRHAGR